MRINLQTALRLLPPTISANFLRGVQNTGTRARSTERKRSTPSQFHGRQFDFVDLGLMVAIEGEIHVKLDALLRETLASALDVLGAYHDGRPPIVPSHISLPRRKDSDRPWS